MKSFMKSPLSLLVAAGMILSGAVRTQATDTPREVVITAKRFEFTPKQITLKKGETVTLKLTSEDVTHGFFVRPLKIDTEIVPGKATEVTITPQATGKFTTICDHFCGAGHGNMTMTIVVEE